MEYKIIEAVEGSTGGKGGGGGGSESPNTLQNNTLVQVLHLLGEGPIQGLATGDGQSIFVNNVPLQGANGVSNYQGANFTVRYGTANQSYIPGFSNVTSVISIGTQVYAASPIVYTVSSTSIDAVIPTLGLPNGLRKVDTSGNINGYNVGIKIEVKGHSSNTWSVVYDVLKTDKTDGNYQWQPIHISRPMGYANTLWDIRVTRTTADDSTSYTQSIFDLVNVVEIQEVQESYDSFAVCGVSLNAEAFGDTVPTLSFLLQGVTVQVPSNYNANTRVYTGSWDGTFQTAFSNNPAWVLYDLLTNTQYGGGVYGITEELIDKFSFYNAAVFCDVQVPSGITGQTEPRFTFDAPIQQRGDALQVARQVAGMMNANLLWCNGLLVLNQDRPANSVMAITKTNIINGVFEYIGTPLEARTTAVNVTYADKANYYYPKIAAVANSAAANVYGFNSEDFAAFGATSEGQAIRAGKWELYFSLNTTESVNFSMGLNGNYLTAGDVIDLYDEDYTQQAGAGRILSATSSQVVLDQPVVISGSIPQIGILLPDGVTYAYYNITNASGTSNTINISGTFAQTPEQFNDYIILSAIKPRQFRIVDIKQGSEPQILAFNAVLYNPNNYAYIESGISLPTSPYSLTKLAAIGDPTNIIVTETASNIQLGESIVRVLIISWNPPTSNNAVSYDLKYRFNSGAYKDVAEIVTTSTDLTNLAPGQYDFILSSVNANGLQSPGNSFSHLISVSGSNTSNLFAPTNFTVNGSGNTFTGQSIDMQWINPAGNQNLPNTGVLMDFQLQIMNQTFSTVLDTYTVPPVAAGANQYFLYTYADNVSDYNAATRNVYARLYARDTKYNLSGATSVVFNNPAPALMSGTVTALANATFVQLTYPSDPDLTGVLVWRSTSSGFSPSSATLIFDGFNNLIPDTGLTPGTTYYYRWAAYDSFGKSYNGTGLNVSTAVSATPTAAGIPSGPTLPGTGVEGALFFDTTDGQLYRYHAGAWTVAVPAVNVTGLLTASQIASLANTQITGLLTATQIASLANTQITGLLTDSQLAAISAAKLTGTITTTQITPNAITSALISAGAVNTAQLAAGAVTAGTIAAGAVSTTQLAAGAVTAGTIASGTITAAQIASGTITATQLAASSVTASQLSAGAVTAAAITAGTITATQLAAGSVTATQIAANAVDASKIVSNSITAGQIAAATIGTGQLAAGSVTASQIAAGSITASALALLSANGASIDMTNGQIVFNNGTYMRVLGTGFGTTGDLIDWYGPTVSSPASCAKSAAVFYLTTSGGAYFGGQLPPIVTRLYDFNTTGGVLTGTEVVPYGVSSCTVLLFGGGGGGASVDNPTISTGGGGGGSFAQKTFAVAAGNQISYNVASTGAGGIWYMHNTVAPGGSGHASSIVGTVSAGYISVTAGGGGAGTASAGGGAGTASGGDVNLSGSAGTFGAPGNGGNAATGGGLGNSGRTGAGGKGDETGSTGGGGGGGSVYFAYS